MFYLDSQQKVSSSELEGATIVGVSDPKEQEGGAPASGASSYKRKGKRRAK